jgi:hypothetical protein
LNGAQQIIVKRIRSCVRNRAAMREGSHSLRNSLALLAATRLAGTGNVAPMPAEGKFFEQVRGGFPWRQKACLDVPFG